MTTQSNNLTISLKAKFANKRFLYVLLVAAYPVLVPGLLSASVFLFSDIEKLRPVGTSTQYASIEYPLPTDDVPFDFSAKGKIEDVPKGHSLFLTTSSQDLYWPKIELDQQSAKWEYKMKIRSGTKLNISVIAVNAEGKTVIDDWFKTGIETGKYPALSNIPGLKIVAQSMIEK